MWMLCAKILAVIALGIGWDLAVVVDVVGRVLADAAVACIWGHFLLLLPAALYIEKGSSFGAAVEVVLI